MLIALSKFIFTPLSSLKSSEKEEEIKLTFFKLKVLSSVFVNETDVKVTSVIFVLFDFILVKSELSILQSFITHSFNDEFVITRYSALKEENVVFLISEEKKEDPFKRDEVNSEDDMKDESKEADVKFEFMNLTSFKVHKRNWKSLSQCL